MTRTRKHGVFFPVNEAEELDKALEAFKVSQDRYEAAERYHRAALERGERSSRSKVDQLEREYRDAAIFAANMMLGQRSAQS